MLSNTRSNRKKKSQFWAFSLFLMLFSSLCFAEDWVYTTRPGDTLWDLSKQFLQDENQWQRIQKYNQIANPKRLPPGKKIRIPYEWLQHKPISAELRAFRGNIIITNHLNKVVSAENGLRLALGYSVATGDNSSAVIQFADKSTLFIRANTKIKLDSINYNEKSAIVDTEIRLENGRVESRVIPFKRSNSRFEIITPTAVAAVRGTTFRVDLREDNSMLNEVVKGKINIKNEFGEQLVDEGFGNVVRKGQAPEKPEALLAAPDLTGLKDIFLVKSIKFRWPVVKGAMQYRVILSSNAKPVNVIIDQSVSTPNFAWDNAEKGQYILQVRGVAGSGLQGMPASHQFNVGLDKAVELSPPKLNTPGDGAQIQSNIPTLHWFNVKDASRYRVQFSAKADFTTTMHDEVVEAQFFQLPSQLKPGKYYWRVAGISAAIQIGPFSEKFELTIK